MGRIAASDGSLFEIANVGGADHVWIEVDPEALDEGDDAVKEEKPDDIPDPITLPEAKGLDQMVQAAEHQAAINRALGDTRSIAQVSIKFYFTSSFEADTPNNIEGTVRN